MNQKYEFQNVIGLGYAAASRVAPVVTKLVGLPRTVVDLGGGGGGWSRAFRDLGSEKVVCIDHPSVRARDLLIPVEDFKPWDLVKSMPPAEPSDLALCIEVAEHLPSTCAEGMVQFLVDSSDLVLFSAAIPKQGGHKHINERRASHWRQLFAAKGYDRVDAVRPQIVSDPSIPWWLRQNLMLYARRNCSRWDELSIVPQFHFPDDFELVSTEILEGHTTTFFQALGELRWLFRRGFVAHVLRRGVLRT